MNQRMVVQVNARDCGGGAAKIAYDLHQSFLNNEIDSWMLVGIKVSHDVRVIRIRPSCTVRAAENLDKVLAPFVGKIRGIGRFKILIVRGLKNTDNLAPMLFGREPMYYPGSITILEQLPKNPDVLHFHNLHGSYFDLRSLPTLTAKIPTVLTLHDAWLLSGHCAHSLGCQKWKTGCGKCPDLSLYPALLTDGTVYNWQRKKRIYQQSKLALVAPSQWLLTQVQESMLAPAAISMQVIHNGINLELFSPGDCSEERMRLGLPKGACILLFVADGGRVNKYKDFAFLERLIKIFALAYSGDVICICIGGKAESSEQAGIKFIYTDYIADHNELVRYYRAADIYVHVARADTFPNVVLEALACGLPVVANNVGGVPEQVKTLEGFCGVGYSADQATGIIFESGNVDQSVKALLLLANNRLLRKRLSDNAACDAKKRFDVKESVKKYLVLYQQLVSAKLSEKL